MDAPHRKHIRRWETPRGVRFLTFSCQRRLPLFSNQAIASLFMQSLARVRQSIELFAYVVMPEHVHVLCRPRADHTIENVLRRAKMGVARQVLHRWATLKAPVLDEVRDATGRPRFWQKGGGFDRLVRDESEFRREVQYIHQNPVERGLVARPDEWKWSSVRWWMGQREGEVECDPPPIEGMDGWCGFMK